MTDTLKTIATGTATISGIEVVHQMPAEEPIKLGMQILLGIVNLIFIIRQNRKQK